MIKLLPECSICGMPVADSVESEIKQHGKIKTGQYIKGTWICDDCKESEHHHQQQQIKKKKYQRRAISSIEGRELEEDQKFQY